MDIRGVRQREPLDLQAAGCTTSFSSTEPAMTRYHDKVFAYGARALDRSLEGVRVPTFVHLCFGYPGGMALQHQFAYPELLAELLRTRIGGFTVEFARSTFDPAVLKACRDRLVMFGCVDPGDTPAPTVEAVKARVRQALEHLDPHRLLLAPDCGLMTISRALAGEKLQVMVEAARQLRRELGIPAAPRPGGEDGGGAAASGATHRQWPDRPAPSAGIGQRLHEPACTPRCAESSNRLSISCGSFRRS